MVSLLLEKGCDPNAKKSSSAGGPTPIDISISRGYTDITALLRRYGSVSQLVEKQPLSTGDGSSSLMKFTDQLPDYLTKKLDPIRKAQIQAMARYNSELNTQHLHNIQPIASSMQPIQEPWRTVRLFISSTFSK
jgi:hypothetical protein